MFPSSKSTGGYSYVPVEEGHSLGPWAQSSNITADFLSSFQIIVLLVEVGCQQFYSLLCDGILKLYEVSTIEASTIVDSSGRRQQQRQMADEQYLGEVHKTGEEWATGH